MVATLIAVLLSQAEPAVAAPDAGASELTAEQKAALAMERLTVAAEKLAAAAERLSPPPPVEEKAAAPAGTRWDFTTNLGLTWSTGNVQSVSFFGSSTGIRKGERTILQYKLFGGYGQTFHADTNTTEVLLENAGATGQFDYRFGKLVSAYLGTGVDTDHVKSVEIRGYGEVGVGLLWLDQRVEKYQKLLLKTDLGLRVQQEQRFQYFPTPANVPDAFLLGPRAALSFRYALNAGTYVQEDLEVIPNVIGDTAGRVLLNNDTKVAVGIAAHVALAAELLMKYDSQPAPGKKPLDTIVTVGLEATY
jgi:hypothetical protein